MYIYLIFIYKIGAMNQPTDPTAGQKGKTKDIKLREVFWRGFGWGEGRRLACRLADDVV